MDGGECVLSRGEQYLQWLSGTWGRTPFVALVHPVLLVTLDVWESCNQTEIKETAFGTTGLGGPSEGISQGQDL